MSIKFDPAKIEIKIGDQVYRSAESFSLTVGAPPEMTAEQIIKAVEGMGRYQFGGGLAAWGAKLTLTAFEGWVTGVLSVTVPDRDNGTPIEIAIRAHWHERDLSGYVMGPIKALDAKIESMVRTLIEHEAEESFKVAGQRPRDPHTGKIGF